MLSFDTNESWVLMFYNNFLIKNWCCSIALQQGSDRMCLLFLSQRKREGFSSFSYDGSFDCFLCDSQSASLSSWRVQNIERKDIRCVLGIRKLTLKNNHHWRKTCEIFLKRGHNTPSLRSYVRGSYLDATKLASDLGIGSFSKQNNNSEVIKLS